MNILITAATIYEVSKLIEYLEKSSESYSKQDNLWLFDFFGVKITVLVTGIGQIATAYSLSAILSKQRFELAFNLGICGAYTTSFLNIGDVVEIGREILGDFGVNNRGKFETVFEQQIIHPDAFPFIDGMLINKANYSWTYQFVEAARLSSISVNTVSGDAEQIFRRIEKFNPDIENMEGGAFFYACLMQKQPFVEIRAVSNYVEPRNKKNWQVDYALERLFIAVKFMLLELGTNPQLLEN